VGGRREAAAQDGLSRLPFRLNVPFVTCRNPTRAPEPEAPAEFDPGCGCGFQGRAKLADSNPNWSPGLKIPMHGLLVAWIVSRAREAGVVER